jgi:peptidoglycan pentaglycine glycine transferase (the first glycine)
MSQLTDIEWENWLKQFSRAHVLQSSAWGKVKGGFGWYAKTVANSTAGAQILFRRLPLGFSIAYLPKGPLGVDWASLWPEVDQICRKERAVFLKVEPDMWEDQTPELDQCFYGFKPGCPTIQPRRTIIVDLNGKPDTWLERMKQKHRYNIRLAEKKEVIVQPSDDISGFHQLMLTTSQRDEFGIHQQRYYQSVYDQFAPSGRCVLLIATFQGTPLAGVMVLRQADRAWYFYGASNNLERQRMPAYLLQFEAMKWAGTHGCTQYDLWGVPDADEVTLENEFEQRSDGLWGVYRFKRGFGGELKRSAAAYEKIYKPSLYWIYSKYLVHRGGLSG